MSLSPFIDHWNQRDLVNPIEIVFKKKKLHLFDAGTKSGDQKSVQGRLVERKYRTIRFLKGERKQKVTLYCLKKKNLFERKENRVETIDYYSRNFLFSRVVIIALIQKVERSLLYFLRASVISFEIRESKQFFSRALVDFFFWLFNQSKCLSVSRVTCFTCSLHFHRDKNITKYQVSNVGLRELENRYMTFLFFFFSFFSVGTWNPSDSVHCFVKVEYRNKWKDQPFSPPSCRVVSVDKISRFLFHIQATRFCIRKEGLGLTRVSVFCIYVQLSWKYYVRNTGCVNTGCGETRSARFSFLPSRSLNY